MTETARLYRLIGVLNLVILAVNIYVPIMFIRGGLAIMQPDRWVNGPVYDNFAMAFGPAAFIGIGVGMALLGLSGILLLMRQKMAKAFSIFSTGLLCLPSWIMALVAYLLGSPDVGPEGSKFVIQLPFIAYDTSATMFFTLYLLIQALIFYQSAHSDTTKPKPSI